MKKLLSAFLSLLLVALLPVHASAALMNLDGKLAYFDNNGQKAAQIGLDLSYFNNQVDFEAIYEQGFEFVIIRLGGRGWGTGRLYDDSQTQTFLHNARDAGLAVGAYFYSTATRPSEALEEAVAVIQTLNGFSLDLPVFIDMEYSGDYPNGRADQLTPGERAEIVSEFCNAIEEAGYQAGIYASEGYMRFDIDREAVSYLPLWMASYTVDNQLPQYIHSFSIWQETDSAYAGGIDGPFDLNIVLS